MFLFRVISNGNIEIGYRIFLSMTALVIKFKSTAMLIKAVFAGGQPLFENIAPGGLYSQRKRVFLITIGSLYVVHRWRSKHGIGCGRNFQHLHIRCDTTEIRYDNAE